MEQETSPESLLQFPLFGELDRLSGLAEAAGQEYNDQLTLIMNYADVSLDRLGAAHPVSPDLREVQHAARRCAHITHTLLALSERARMMVRYAKMDGANSGHRDLV